jgi:hypothetical protein
MGGGADHRHGSNHAFAADPSRALSILIDLPRTDVTRGGPPLDVQLRIQNTGAGHAFPTGSPWKVARLEAALQGPVDASGKPATASQQLAVNIGRRLETAPPWRTLEDTRIAPGDEARFSFRPQLAHEAPAGAWSLRVSATWVNAGAAEPGPFLVREIPLRVD